ncbi:thioredoxin-related transmembrane protein 2 homolog [Oratosquilla oratoria]|uniref:thioredoxin-related transmembrane protein 2 homolog n=1 Tax=Oratosquilla oratoria TaxID=337810 RepID=UPI003F7597B6
MSLKEDLVQLLHPYYITNILLSLSFVVCKTTPLCHIVFAGESCEFSMWESEVMFFMLVVIMFRSRKTDSRSMLSYISLASMYAKVGNVILWFSSDPIQGIVYCIISLIIFLIIGEPVYKGPEAITYFRANALDDEIVKDPSVTWLIAYYAAWNPQCTSFAHVFAKLSNEYALENLKFGKIDVGRYPDVAKKHHINITAFSVQLPTVSIFKNGKEVMRRPCLDSKGKFQKFYFTEDNMRAAFDLNNLHSECQKSLLAKKKNKKEDHEKKD